MYHENEINIYSDDGVRLSLWKIEPISTNSDTNVFLTHGAFSNKDIFWFTNWMNVLHDFITKMA